MQKQNLLWALRRAAVMTLLSQIESTVGVVNDRVGTVVVQNWYCFPSMRPDLVVAKLIATSTDNKVVDALCFSGALCTSHMSPSTKCLPSPFIIIIPVDSLRSLLGSNRFGQQMASSLLH